MSSIRLGARSHTQIIEQHHLHKKMITSMMDSNDRKSTEAKARFERPLWSGLFSSKEV